MAKKKLKTCEGIVDQVTKKMVKTKNGKKPIYSFQVDGDWYKCSFKKPDIEEGDEVSFEFYKDEYGFQVDDVSAIEVTGHTDPGDDDDDDDDDAPASKKGGGAGKPDQQYWEDKDSRIALHACRNSAVAMVTALVQSGALELGKTQKKKVGIFEAAVAKYTEQFFLEVNNVERLRELVETAHGADDDVAVDDDDIDDIDDDDDDDD